MFPTTHWSALMPLQRRQLFEQLAGSYWRPLYLYARMKGLDHTTAEDVVQGLFTSLLQGDSFARLDRTKGRLRSYLKACLAHHLADRRDHAAAAKRGGDVIQLPLDAAEHVQTPVSANPDVAYDRAWASALVRRAFDRLRAEHGSDRRWELIELYFAGDCPAQDVLAMRFDMSIPQIKSLLHRARARFRRLVREEVLATVATPDGLPDELALIETYGFS